MRSNSRTSVTSSKKRGASRVSTPRGLGRSISTIPAIRPGRGLITTTRDERNTASEIECVTKTTVERETLPDREQLEVEALARHLVECAERLVHQQKRGLERESARDRRTLLHAAGELPGMVVAEALELDEVEHLRHARPAPLLLPAEHLERQRDVLRDRAPVEEHCVLEHDPVVAVDARLLRRLAVDGHRSRRRLDQVADHAQQRRLAAARRADQRDELARLQLEIDVLECGDVSLRERLRHALDRDDRLRRSAHVVVSGARRTTIFSASTTRTKKKIPTSAATMFVAQSSCGSSE